MLPALSAKLAREAARKANGDTPGARRVDYGVVGDLIQEGVARGCLFSATFHDTARRPRLARP